jgi:hypothetical protein
MGIESLHEICNEIGVRVVNYNTSENLIVKNTIFPHRSTHKYSWASPDGKIHNRIDHVLIHKRRLSNNIVDVQAFRGADSVTEHLLL